MPEPYDLEINGYEYRSLCLKNHATEAINVFCSETETAVTKQNLVVKHGQIMLNTIRYG